MPNILQEFKAIHQRLDKMDQEISKCRQLDGFSAQTKFQQLLRRVDEVSQQVSEWHAEAAKTETRSNTEQYVKDQMAVLLGKLSDLEHAQNQFRTKLLRLWFRSDKFLSVLVPAANALELFKANGWKTRRAQQVLAQLTGRLEKVERRGFWRRLWRFIRGGR